MFASNCASDDSKIGTGKTTTARRMGELLYPMGVLATPEVIECSVTDLVGEIIGHTGPKVIELFDRALGKVLFTDETYRLCEKNQFCKDAIGEILGALMSPRFQEKIFIILAGYGQEMDLLLASNPGLRSGVMTFDSLTGEQSAQLLIEILDNKRYPRYFGDWDA